MKQQLESLQKSIGKLMQEHLSNSDFQSVTVLSPLLARVQELQKQDAEIEHEISEIDSTLKLIKARPSSQNVAELLPQLPSVLRNDDETGHGRRQTLKIRIDWKANKRNKELEEICENTAASSMATFVSRLVQEFGQTVLSKLEQVRINRGPLISKTPATDFLNVSQGKLYGHKKVRGTEYYVLTHSQTSQKITDLNKICRILGFVPGSVQIEQVGRDSWLDGLLN